MFIEKVAYFHAIVAGVSSEEKSSFGSGNLQTGTSGIDIGFVDQATSYLITGFWFVVYFILTLILLWWLLKIIRLMYEMVEAQNFTHLKVTMPRADSKLDKEQETKKDFKEKTGIMSVFFNAVHKMDEASLKDTVLDIILEHAKFGLELVYHEGQVHFYVTVPKQFASLFSQQITGNYPTAEVIPITPDEFPNIRPKGTILEVASTGKANEGFFPIRTYKYFEDDPLSTLTNAFGSLDKEDVAVVQWVMKPIGDWYNTQAKEVAAQVSKGKYVRGGGQSIVIRVLKVFFAPLVFVWNLFVHNSAGDGSGSTHPGAGEGDAYKIFNQAETEAHKMIGESAGQSTFKGSIRILVSSKDGRKAKEAVHSLVSTLSIYTDEYNNKLDNPQFVEDLFKIIITPLRYFSFRFRLVGMLQNVNRYGIDELTTMYHFPDVTYNRSPIIAWSDYKKLAPPHNLKIPQKPTMLIDYKRDKKGNVYTQDGTLLKVDDNKNLIRDKNRNFITVDGITIEIAKDGDRKGKPIDERKTPIQQEQHRYLGKMPLYKDATLMGWNEYRNKKTPVYFNRKDRGRHHYIIGKSGGGKSVFIGYLARQDLWNGDGLSIIDPHGDLVEDLLAFTPKERAKDVVVFDPGDWERPMGLNMLEVLSDDPAIRAIEKDRAALDTTSIFIKIFNEEIFGPRLQHYFRNGALTLMDDEEEGGTIIDVPRLFTDEAFMKYKSSKVKNPVVRSFWEHEYANTGERERQEMIPYFSAKFGPFITNTMIRNIIGQPKSAFNIRQTMDSQKVLLVNLSKGLIGDLNAQLLGLIMISKINMAAMSRADTPEHLRKDFFLYVDEFQNFATDTFGEILSEARKYKLALIMAHQFIAQIGGGGGHDGKPSIKDAVFGNCGTMMSFKVGAEDAEYLEKEYAPSLSQQDIIGIANFTTYCKLNINNATTRPFDIKTIWDNTYKNTEVAKIIKEYSRKMYGRKKEYVDMEIEARIGITK